MQVGGYPPRPFAPNFVPSTIHTSLPNPGPVSPPLPDCINTLHVRFKAEFARTDIFAFFVGGSAGFAT